MCDENYILEISHVSPLKPSGHSHTGTVATTEQLPPFSHGLVLHWVIITTSQTSPVYPGEQTQVLLSLLHSPLIQGGSHDVVAM